MAKQGIGKIQQMLKKLTNNVKKANLRALARVGLIGEKTAKLNTRQNFPARADGPTKTNKLMNSIFWDLRNIGGKETLVIGTRGVIYAKLQEFGYKNLKPKSARFLWLPLKDKFRKGSKYKNLTPTEYIQLKESDPSKHFFFKRGMYRSAYGDGAIAAKRTSNRKDGLRRLWLMKLSVTIPPRPYLRPAARIAAKQYPRIFNEEYKRLSGS